MNTPIIRSADLTLRDQQWSRLGYATLEFMDTRENVHNLRSAIAAAKAALAWEWQFPEVDVELSLMLQKRIRSRVDALKLATDALSSIQSELECLQTALGDNYERTEE